MTQLRTANDTSRHWLRRWRKRCSQAVTLVIWINVLMVVFNLSYVSLRPFYLEYVPFVVHRYDVVKGITPQPLTEQYLETIEELRSHLTPSNTLAATADPVLADLRQQSISLVEENPFLSSNQVASFARLKRRIQAQTRVTSAQAAFEQFWQRDRLNQMGWSQADDFIDHKIEPLLERNYFRAALPTGQYVDEFWRIDLLFILFFGGELLVRTFLLSRSQPRISWTDALARRWYELPLVLPFGRWLRVIPAAIRTHRTQLFDVEQLMAQITHEPAAYLSDRVSKYIMVRLINQAQSSVTDGQFLRGWETPESYVTIGSEEKVDQLIDRILQIAVERVMPTVQPDVEHLLQHSLKRTLGNSRFYEGLQQIPGLSVLPGDALGAISEYLAQSACEIIVDAYADEEGQLLMEQLSRDIRHELTQELHAQGRSSELQRLLLDVLEEWKINYVQQPHPHDPEATLQEVNALDLSAVPN